jgi:excisionase family DNA binding protein
MARRPPAQSRPVDDDSIDPLAIPGGTLTEELQKNLQRQAEEEGFGWPTIAEAAVQLDIPQSTLRRWCAQGRLRAVTVDRGYRVDPSEAIKLAVQDERIKNAAGVAGVDPSEALTTTAPASMASTHVGRVDPAQVPGGAGGVSVAMMQALADLLSTTNGRLRSDQQHTEALVQVMMGSVPKQSVGFEAQIRQLLAHNEDLSRQNKELRDDLREYYNSQKTDKLKEKEMEIKAQGAKGWMDLGRELFPQVIAMVNAHITPNDSSPVDRSIASLLSRITQEQAIALHTKGLVSDAQAAQAVQFRTSTPAPGALCLWMRSFTPETLAKILSEDILSKEQKIAFAAAHDAAGRINLAAPAPAPALAPAPPPAAGASTAAPAAPAAGVKVGPSWRILEIRELLAMQSLITALFELADDEISYRGETVPFLKPIWMKIPEEHRKQFKAIKWDRVEVETP